MLYMGIFGCFSSQECHLGGVVPLLKRDRKCLTIFVFGENWVKHHVFNNWQKTLITGFGVESYSFYEVRGEPVPPHLKM